jgi:uncharacterized protein (DUF58 family)
VNRRESNTLCSPEILAGITDLRLVARIIVEGLISGLHRSPFHGYSAEFSQYRHYRPGDDLKYVDWRLVARTDRVYTKQFRETTNMASSFVIDTSRSMEYPEQGMSKLRYAAIAAAALAYLLVMQGDAAGLVTDDTFMPSRTGRHHLDGILGRLSTLAARGTWHPAETIRRAAERLGRRGLLIVLSDFYDEEDETYGELRRAARLGHEIVVLQVMSREEISFDFRDAVEFVDAETGHALSLNPAESRREYIDSVTAFVERWRVRAGAEGFQYSLIITDTRHDRALRNLLLARQYS